MGYRRMNINDLKSIYRRWKAGQKISFISTAEGFDRKTIRNYIRGFEKNGLNLDVDTIAENDLHTVLLSLLPCNEREHTVQASFHDLIDEIRNLVSDKVHPVKPKTAYRIVKRKYDLTGSYESFKVFFKKSKILPQQKKIFPRIEIEPGKETQIDYCTVGYHMDPVTKKNRRVYAFVGKLSSSRHSYIEFVYSQKQEDFVESNINMIEFFNGTTEHITIDNLKSGVIKAHIYDPKLNKAYADFAEHYGIFINPCMAGHAKGKAKVERQMQEVRELYRELIAVHPGYTLSELNQEARRWCLEEYGMRNHGTTGEKPYEVFEKEEQPLLKPLNPVRFEVPEWKEVTVHADQFFSFNKKRYAMPAKYRGSRLLCSRTGALLKVFDKNHTHLRTYAIGKDRIQYCKGDFPESYEAMMNSGYPQYLIHKAASFGSSSKKLIEEILKPHAFIKARCARGMLTVIESYKDQPFLQEICLKACRKRLFYPKTLKEMLEREKSQLYFDFIIPRSSAGEAMIRDIKEYIN